MKWYIYIYSIIFCCNCEAQKDMNCYRTITKKFDNLTSNEVEDSVSTCFRTDSIAISSYFKNDTITSKVYYSLFTKRPNGMYIRYAANTVVGEQIYLESEPVGMTQWFYRNKNPSNGTYTPYNTELNGYELSLTEKGSPKHIGLLDTIGCPTGIWFYYHSNGHLKERGSYTTIDGLEIFQADKQFLVNGVAATPCNIKNAQKNMRFKVKDGIWEYFDENGNIEKKEVWNKGIFLK